MSDGRWKQFSLYPVGCRNKFQPQQVLHEFLPLFIKAVRPTRWHVFFEPSALVRVQADDLEQALSVAEYLASETGLVFERGDSSSSSPEDYPGEEAAYGETWEAFADFFQAASEISLTVSKLPHDQQLLMTRKILHICLNTLGLNYLEEATFCRYYADNAVELMKKYYRM